MSPNVTTRGTRPLLCVLLALLAGCMGRGSATLEQIEADQLALPAVYLTAEGREVIVPGGGRDVIVAPGTREIAFRAYTCVNPACPNRERGSAERPFLFTWPDPLWKVDERGELQFDVVPDRAAETVRRGGLPEPTCPGCATIRDKTGESAQVRQRYRDWVVYYELPESARRRKELDAEHRRQLQAQGRRR